MVFTPAVAAGLLGFSIAQGAWVSRGLAFLLSPFAFSFGASVIGPRVLSVSIGVVTTSSASFAHLSSFALFVFSFAFVVVRVVKGSRVVA